MLNKDIQIIIKGRVGSRKGQIAALIQNCLQEKGAHVEVIHTDSNTPYLHDDKKPEIQYQDIAVKITCEALGDLDI